MDEDTVELLGIANKSSEAKMAEAVRHNKQIEKIEETRLVIEQKKLESMEWQGKSDQLSFKVNLVKHYKDMKSNGFSDKHIVRLMPEMKAVIEALANTSSDSDNEK
jgi:hypothetical protein